MTELAKPDRDPHNLTPDLLARWFRVRDRMLDAGHPIVLIEGRRSTERQAWLYAQGRTRPGPIVTRAKPGIGRHEPGPDGLGRAFDCAFAGPEPFSEKHPWELYGQACEAEGLEWGGRWRHPDRPHAELKP